MGDQITEDLVEVREEPSSRPPFARFGWLAIGVGVGLAIAVLVNDFNDNEPELVATPTSEAPTTADLEPGLTAGFRVVTSTDAAHLDLIVWPPAVLASTTTRMALPIGDAGGSVFPTFDVSGLYLAVEAPSPSGSGSLLYVGAPQLLAPVASDVLSHAWHDSVTGSLGYLTIGSTGEIELWRLDGGVGPATLIATVTGVEDAGLVGFGDWGWALQEGDEVVILSVDGEELRAHDGSLQDSDPDGWLLLRHEGQPVVVSPEGEERSFQLGAELDDVVRLLDHVGDWLASSFAGSHDRIAILGSRGMAVIGDDRVAYYERDPGLIHRRGPIHTGLFTSDTHVSYVQDTGGAVIVDLTTGNEFDVLPGETIRALVFTG